MFKKQVLNALMQFHIFSPKPILDTTDHHCPAISEKS